MSFSTSSLCELRYFSRWYLIVEFKRKGLEQTPKTTRVNLSGQIITSSSLMLSTHRNRNTSRSFSFTVIIRNAFSMSAVSAIRYARNLIKMSRILWLYFGPTSNRSMRVCYLVWQRHCKLCVIWLCPCHYGSLRGAVSSGEGWKYPSRLGHPLQCPSISAPI